MPHAEFAILSPAFPCNPRPFANRINELCTGNTDAIKSDAAKACLLVLIQQAWGQACTIDTVREYAEIAPRLEILQEIGGAT